MRPGTSDIFKHVDGGRSGTERVFTTNTAGHIAGVRFKPDAWSSHCNILKGGNPAPRGRDLYMGYQKKFLKEIPPLQPPPPHFNLKPLPTHRFHGCIRSVASVRCNMAAERPPSSLEKSRKEKECLLLVMA